jgi:hypothetical protein
MPFDLQTKKKSTLIRPTASAAKLQRKSDKGQEKRILLQPICKDQVSTAIPPIVQEVLRSPGRLLGSMTHTLKPPLFGHDFSNVRIHTDDRAAESARLVKAQAYTVGRDIVFGTGHNPETKGGEGLLAHELAHVEQQSRSGVKILQRMPLNTNYRFDTYSITGADLSDPEIVARFKALNHAQLIEYRNRVEDPSVKGYINNLLATSPGTSLEILYGISLGKAPLKMKISGIQVIIEADKYSTDKELTNKARTPFKLIWSAPFKASGGKITSFNLIRKLTIQTIYGPGAPRTGPSKFGRGTTEEDIKAGKTTLGYHEGSHADELIRFLKENPPPTFQGRVGISTSEFHKRSEKFGKEMADYEKKMKAQNVADVDCTGEKDPICSGLESASPD